MTQHPLFEVPEQYQQEIDRQAEEHVDMEYTPDPGGKSGTLKPTDYPKQAKEAVVDHYNAALRIVGTPYINDDDVFVVWFAKVLQNWKALVGSTIAGYYFELTYNGDKHVLYIDSYRKVDNSVLERVPKQRTNNEHC